MKIPEPGITNQPVLRENAAWLKVVVVYEDLATGARTKRTFDHLLSRIGDGEDFQFDLWRFDLLRNLELNARAASEAAAADIVVPATHGRANLPAEVEFWLCQWLDNQEDKPSALVVSMDKNSRELRDSSRLLVCLRSLAAPAGVDLIPHFGEPQTDFDLVAGPTRNQAGAEPQPLPEGPRLPDACEHWELNVSPNQTRTAKPGLAENRYS